MEGMMQIRCYKCGWGFSIGKDEIVFALEGLKESEGAHYNVRCQRCRQTNKISIEQLERAAPKKEEKE
jgi:phage FluMu protein Com